MADGPTSTSVGEPDHAPASAALAAVRASRAAITVTDMVLDPPGPSIVYVNPAFETLTGYRAADVIGRSPRLLQGPLTDRAVVGRITDDLRRTGTFEGETVNYRADGTPFVMSWRIATTVDDDGRGFYVAVQENVTEARRHEQRHRDTIASLRRGLLPATPPQHPHLVIDTAYRSFDGGSLLPGGDWFDVVPIDADHVGLVIGDVVGHGIDPAATMGQLRWAINALLAANVSVAHAVQTIRRMCRREGIAASLAVVRWHLWTGVTSTTIAGHPSPLVVDAAGARPLVTEPPAPYLGAPFDWDDHVVTGHVAPDASLVLFTDGILSREAPPQIALAAVERLARASIESSDRPASSLLELVDGDDHDDAAVLVVRRRTT